MYSLKKFNERYGYNRRERICFLSFPKSGRTWVRVFLNNYYFNLSPFLLLDWKYSKANKNIPYILFSHSGYREIDELKSIRHFYKINQRNKIIFMLRDPRDIFISYYFQLTKRKDPVKINSNINWSSISISELLRHRSYGINKIISFFNNWSKVLKNNKNVYIFSYENLTLNTENIFRDLLFFLGEINVNNKAFYYSLKSSSFSEMQKRERNGVHSIMELSPENKNDKDSYKTRKGKIGGFRNYMTDMDIAYCNSKMQNIDSYLKIHLSVFNTN